MHGCNGASLPVDRKTHSLECDGKLFGWARWNCRLATLAWAAIFLIFLQQHESFGFTGSFVWFVLEL